MIPISLSSNVCEYNTNTTTNTTSNINNNNNNNNNTINTTTTTTTIINNITSNNNIDNEVNSFIPLPVKFRPCLILNKEYQYCNTAYTAKKENPLKYLYDSPSLQQQLQDDLSPRVNSLSSSPQTNIQQYDFNNSNSNNGNNNNNNNEQTTNSINFEMDSINNEGNSHSNVSSLSSSPTMTNQQHPHFLKKRSISFSVRNLNLLSHQVAGQAPLLKLPDGKILKPMVPKEYQFYESTNNHHKEFKDFIPTFYGVLDLGNFDFQFLEESFKSHPLHSFDYNHWKNKIISLPKDYQNLYIKIEDLTYLCKCPCILDLKMGTRQYGVDAPLEKIRNMEEKCRNTTSSSLGFRVCGLKVYDQKNSMYSSFDKFFGRKLTDVDIPSVICKFIDNGLRHRNEILLGISKRLYQLITLFEQQQCFKFYGSSLLLIYDGQSTNLQDAKINIKMVDFAHATPNYLDQLQQQQLQSPQPIQSISVPTSPISTPLSMSSSSISSTTTNNCNNNKDLDEGYLFGLKNLLKIINNLIQVSNTINGETI